MILIWKLIRSSMNYWLSNPKQNQLSVILPVQVHFLKHLNLVKHHLWNDVSEDELSKTTVAMKRSDVLGENIPSENAIFFPCTNVDVRKKNLYYNQQYKIFIRFTISTSINTEYFWNISSFWQRISLMPILVHYVIWSHRHLIFELV